MVSKDIPSDRIGFTACKACHDGFKVTTDVYEFTGFFHGGTIQAVGSACLADNHNRWIFFIFVSKISDNSSGEGTNTSLYKYMCRTVDTGFF